MSEHTALQQAARDYDVLRHAVLNFLDQYYEDDVTGSAPSWPSELEKLVGWREPV